VGLANLPSAKFLIGMVFLIVFIFAGGRGVLEEGKGPAFAGAMTTFEREILHLIEGNDAFWWGKLCI